MRDDNRAALDNGGRDTINTGDVGTALEDSSAVLGDDDGRRLYTTCQHVGSNGACAKGNPRPGTVLISRG